MAAQKLKEKNNFIKFAADKVRLTGPKVDGGFTVSFDVGEYMWNSIKELPTINGKTILVAVVYNQKKDEKQEEKEEDIKDVVDAIPKLEG